MPLDLTGLGLAEAIVAAMPATPANPIAANAMPPSFEFAAGITAQPVGFSAGTIYVPVTSGQLITQFTNGYLTNDPPAVDGYYQFIPDGYYSQQQTAGQLKNYQELSFAIVNYFVANCDVLVNVTNTILDGYGRPCSGEGFGTPTGGGLR
jgi:hypothetical protein